MSIVFSNEDCCVLDQEKYINSQFRKCRLSSQYNRNGGKLIGRTHADILSSSPHQDHEVAVLLRNVLFEIKVPFMMDSEFNKHRHQLLEEYGFENLPDAKKRKRPQEGDNFGAKLWQKLHTVIPQTRSYWDRLSSGVIPFDNNMAARNFAKTFAELQITLPQKTVLENTTDVAVVHEHGNQPYIIPPKSRYCCSLLSDIQCLSEMDSRYDLIVIDPPWSNKSAKRLRTYEYVNEEEFKQIPIRQLARPGCLVCLWVTNNDRLRSFAETELFPFWGVKKVAEWIWFKVTVLGQPVCKLTGGHKRPYEFLLIGRVSEENKEYSVIPREKIILSVPSAVHSHKPSLNDLLRPFLPGGAECLELFARSLCSGWTSWGLEVLKFQHLSLYETIADPQ